MSRRKITRCLTLVAVLLVSGVWTGCTPEEDLTPAKELVVALDLGRQDCRALSLAVYKSWARMVRRETVEANDHLPATELKDDLRMDRQRALALVVFLDATHAKVQRDLPWDAKDQIEAAFESGRALCAAASGATPMRSRSYGRETAEKSEEYDRRRRALDELIVFEPGEKELLRQRVAKLLARPVA